MPTSSQRKLFRPKQNEGQEKDNDHLLQADSPTSAQTNWSSRRELECAAENLDSVVVLAKGELERAQAEEERARQEELARQRDAIAGQILHHSRLADEAMATLAANVLPLAELFRQYSHCGGGIKCEPYQGRLWRGPEEFSSDGLCGVQHSCSAPRGTI
jgi:hypothetical protein